MRCERSTSLFVCNFTEILAPKLLNHIFVLQIVKMNPIDCPCGSGQAYRDCCQPYHLKEKVAPTAEALMRSRYTAFVVLNGDYLYETTHAGKRKGNSKDAYLKSAKNTKWLKLEIVTSTYNTVEFKAFYLNNKFGTEVLHEKSNFKLENGKWYYIDGVFY